MAHGSSGSPKNMSQNQPFALILRRTRRGRQPRRFPAPAPAFPKLPGRRNCARAHAAVGHGHLYQGRFKSFPIQQDQRLLTVRYVQRNPLRAKLAKSAQQWRWRSCAVRFDPAHPLHALLADWPVRRRKDWLQGVNAPQTPPEEAAVQEHIRRNRPWGDQQWVTRTAEALNLGQKLRPRGRPPAGGKPGKSPTVRNSGAFPCRTPLQLSTAPTTLLILPKGRWKRGRQCLRRPMIPHEVR